MTESSIMQALRHKTTFKVAYLLILAAVAWLSCRVALLSTVKAQADKQIQVQPFVAELSMTSYTESPNGEVVQRTLLGRSSNGVTVRKEITKMKDSAGDLVRDLTLPDGRQIRISDQHQIRTTMIMPRLQLAKLKSALTQSTVNGCHADANGVTETFAGTAFIGGQEIELLQKEQGAANQKTIRVTVYRAVDLNCEEIGRKMEEKTSGGTYITKWEDIPQDIQLSEPASEDVDPGASYREVPPSEFLQTTDTRAALMYKAVQSGWCNTHDCTAVYNSMKHIATLDNRYSPH